MQSMSRVVSPQRFAQWQCMHKKATILAGLSTAPHQAYHVRERPVQEKQEAMWSPIGVA